jgi:hypothetical protein
MTDTNDGQPTLGSLGYTEQFTWGSEQDPEPPVAKRHWGKYRGTVVDNQDPLACGRLLVSVPGIVTTANWALPCVPLTDLAAGTFMRPRIGANVWIEFERGDPDKPVWVGGWWGEGEIPAMAEEYNAVPAISVMTIESTTAGISICDVPILAGGDTPGNVNIIADAGAVTIALTPGSVNITAPDVTITAEGIVNVSARTVTIEGAVAVTGDLTVEGAVEVTGDLAVGGAVEVTGLLTAQGGVAVTGLLTAQGGVAVTGLLTAQGGVAVTGLLTAQGGVAVTGLLTVDGVPVP